MCDGCECVCAREYVPLFNVDYKLNDVEVPLHSLDCIRQVIKYCKQRAAAPFEPTTMAAHSHDDNTIHPPASFLFKI